MSLRDEARAIFLQKKTKGLLNEEELQELWVLLENSVPHGNNISQQLIDYIEFKRISSLCNPKAKKYFNPRIFAKLQKSNSLGKISVIIFFNYVMRKVWFQHTKINLSLYDYNGQGFLRETDLENYILELIPTLKQLNSLDKTFYPFYVCIAVRQFFFFLDPMNHGRIKILDVLESGFLDDLLELREDDLPHSKAEANWFSAVNALRLYGEYIDLDSDQTGMLNKTELTKLRSGSLSSIFLDRIFEEYITYEGEIDFKGFIDLMLMLENKKEPQAIYQFFKIFDINKKNWIDSFVLNIFFKSLQEKLIDQLDPISFSDVCSEIFDMVKPEIPTKITFNDLVMCGQGDIVVSILTDANGFWAYENREYLLLGVQEEAVEV